MVCFVLALSILSQSYDDRASAAANIALAAISPVIAVDDDIDETKPSPIDNPTLAAPRVQLLIFSGTYCQPCQQLKAALKKQLIDDMVATGKAPWNISEEKTATMRYITDTKHQEEFTKRGIKSIPHLVWRVDGIEEVTQEREPSKLAEGWNKRFKELPSK